MLPRNIFNAVLCKSRTLPLHPWPPSPADVPSTWRHKQPASPPLSLDSGQIHPQLPSPADQPRWRRCKQQASPPSPWTLARITPSCLKSIHTPAQQVSLSPGVAQLSQSSEISQKEKSHLASSTCEHHASLATLFPT